MWEAFNKKKATAGGARRKLPPCLSGDDAIEMFEEDEAWKELKKKEAAERKERALKRKMDAETKKKMAEEKCACQVVKRAKKQKAAEEKKRQ